jgi:hypothetical protein
LTNKWKHSEQSWEAIKRFLLITDDHNAIRNGVNGYISNGRLLPTTVRKHLFDSPEPEIRSIGLWYVASMIQQIGIEQAMTLKKDTSEFNVKSADRLSEMLKIYAAGDYPDPGKFNKIQITPNSDF